MKNTKDTNRRDFLKSGATALAGAFCFSAGLKEALAFAKSVGKPILTENTLNELLKKNYEARRIRTLAKEISSNPATWLKKEFALTQNQIKVIGSIASYHWNEVKKVLSVVEKHGSYLTVQLEQTDNRTPLTVETNAEYFGLCDGKGKGKATVKATADKNGNASVEASISYEFSM